MTTLLIVLAFVAGIIISAYLVMNYVPSFGGKLSEERMRTITRSRHFEGGKFRNLIPTAMDTSLKTNISILLDFMKGTPEGKPVRPIAAERWRPLRLQDNRSASVTWLGHSALWLEVEGKTMIVDPMLGRTPSPFPQIGGKRYRTTLSLQLDQLPPIDAVLISHDHYDHLDYGTIMKLKDNVKRFFVPLGVGAHLERWGIDRKNITELDWWEEAEFEGLTLASTPARHFSGRRLTGRDTTLWCSWVIKGEYNSLFFSGDSGYGPHFKQIGDKYGPFDLTLMECGQYDRRWSAIHMVPEETVQAHLDVKGKRMIPIHWGAFSLAMHAWTDPVERAVKAAKEKNAAICTPKIGETVVVGSGHYPSSAWWRHQHDGVIGYFSPKATHSDSTV
ncbi:membrane protein [Paenibacillus beijingensis]|uniref:Membrane protein n=2 Tax=Paenibacillus beijingensis TaxID=1126833 RepID=A0A0D5NRW7_9BACL|nr:MBL fold metallo-hydrolase [Paenibacillus beijingensis]AJY77623.1 membrane protein [Paenibacillus beijingensis]